MSSGFFLSPQVILYMSLCTKIIVINAELMISLLCKQAVSVLLKSQQGRESRRVRDKKACPPAFAPFWSDPGFFIQWNRNRIKMPMGNRLTAGNNKKVNVDSYLSLLLYFRCQMNPKTMSGLKHKTTNICLAKAMVV